MPDQTSIADLISKYLDGNASTEEQLMLEQWYAAMLMDKKAYGEIAGINEIKTASWEAIKQQIEGERVPVTPVHRIHFLRTAWFRYAAAILILIGVGTYIYVTRQKEEPSVTQTNPVPLQNDIAPGGNRATLTLADGSKIILDSAANGKLAEQGTMTIEKKGERIIYSPLTSRLTPHASRVSFNTMATPRGGQYQLTLPDGSQVWLNAESSITYPTAFTGKERKVSITGEVYFEVRKDKVKKFIVACHPNKAVIPSEREGSAEKAFEIEVIGTQFNVNAYKEEPTINTTLIEGSVRLTSHRSPLTSVPTSLTLTPGQQGQLKDQQLSLAVNPNMEQVMAWKNGAFSFEKIALAAALREISRWYDVEVIYPNGIPQITLGGGMGRDLNLSEVLKVLEGLGVKAKLDQKKLYISK